MVNQETPDKTHINKSSKAYPSIGSYRLFFIFIILLSILLNNPQSTKAWQAKYYKNKATQYPNEIYYHKRYIQILLKKKMNKKCLDYINSIKKKQLKIYNLLIAYYHAAIGNTDKAKYLWRKIWPKTPYYFKLIPIYRRFNLSNQIIPMLEQIYKIRPSLSIAWSLYNYLKAYNQKEKLYNLLLDMGFKYNNKSNIIKKRFLSNISGYKDSLLAKKSINLFLSRKKSKNNRLINELRVMIYLKNRNYQKALEISKTLFHQNPSYKNFIIDIIKKLHDKKSTALEFFKIISHLKLKNKHMYILATLYSKSNIKKTIRILKKLIQSGYSPNKVLRLLYQSLAVLKKHKESVYYLNRISRKIADDYKNAGIYYMILKKINLAQINFSRLPTSLKSLYTSLLYIYNGKKNTAQKILQKHIKNNPYSPNNNSMIDLLFFLKDSNIKSPKLLSSIIISYLKNDFYKTGKKILKIKDYLSEFWKIRALLLVADFYQNSSRIHETLKILNTIIESNTPLKDRAIFKKANILKYKLKKIKAANELFFNLIAKFPNSIYLYKARRELLQTD